MKLTHAEMDRYLRVVPQADGLELVFISLLRRIPDERDYITNTLTEGNALSESAGHDTRKANEKQSSIPRRTR